VGATTPKALEIAQVMSHIVHGEIDSHWKDPAYPPKKHKAKMRGRSCGHSGSHRLVLDVIGCQ